MKICYQYKNFRSDSLDRIEVVNSITEDYQRQGYQLTLRQLYYQLVSRGFINNEQKEYKNLGSLVNDARLSGLIDWDSIIDRTRNLQTRGRWSGPRDIIKAAANSFHLDRWQEQSYRVECWVEKDALIGVVERACHTWDVPYFACRGYTSQSEMWSASQRLYQYMQDDKMPVILHLGDHDPSGIDMSRDIEERLKMFIEHHLDEDGQEIDSYPFIFKRLALNWDQISQYNPPPNPAKLTDSRSDKYISEYGDESWELDALEPKVITDLIEENIREYMDSIAWAKTVNKENKERKELTIASRRWDQLSHYIGTQGWTA